jgi:uncharacterized membrane protein YphA (DoxX/SURF4 family)
MGIALACYPWHDPASQPGRQAATLNAYRIIVAGTYIWSGLQKLNSQFISDVFPWLLKPILAYLPDNLGSVVLGCAPVVPIFETGIGVGLLIPRLRPFAVTGAAAMHLLILTSLGLQELDHNFVVWPWNMAMPIWAALLFLRAEPLGFAEVLRPRRWLHGLALVFFGILPALDFVELWDPYLSASLYSGSTPNGFIFVRASVRDRVPEALRAYLIQVDDSSYQLNLYDWSLNEMNVPDYRACRVYQAIARRYLPYANDPSEVLLDYWSRPDWQTGKRTLTKYYGQDLSR